MSRFDRPLSFLPAGMRQHPDEKQVSVPPFPELAANLLEHAIVEACEYLGPPEEDALHLRYNWAGYVWDIVARPRGSEE